MLAGRPLALPLLVTALLPCLLALVAFALVTIGDEGSVLQKTMLGHLPVLIGEPCVPLQS